jgi:hypothetical protein
MNPQVHQRVHKSLRPVPTLNHMNPVHIHKSCFLKIYFDTIFPSTSWYPPLGVFGYNFCMNFSSFPCVLHVPPTQSFFSWSCWYYVVNSSKCEASHCPHPPVPSPLRYKYYRSRPPSMYFFLRARDQVSHPYQVSCPFSVAWVVTWTLKFCNISEYDSLLLRGVVKRPSNWQDGGPPIVVCPRLLIQYVHRQATLHTWESSPFFVKNCVWH